MPNHPLRDHRPPEFEGLLLDFWWEIDKLHALDLPTRQVSREELDWQLDLPWWNHEGIPFQLTPWQVAADPETYDVQFGRTMTADLSYPIIVREVDGQLVVVDGVHRLLKAVLTGLDQVTVAQFDDSLISAIEVRR